jgi:hypothetical protein
VQGLFEWDAEAPTNSVRIVDRSADADRPIVCLAYRHGVPKWGDVAVVFRQKDFEDAMARRQGAAAGLNSRLDSLGLTNPERDSFPHFVKELDRAARDELDAIEPLLFPRADWPALSTPNWTAWRQLYAAAALGLVPARWLTLNEVSGPATTEAPSKPPEIAWCSFAGLAHNDLPPLFLGRLVTLGDCETQRLAAARLGRDCLVVALSPTALSVLDLRASPLFGNNGEATQIPQAPEAEFLAAVRVDGIPLARAPGDS